MGKALKMETTLTPDNLIKVEAWARDGLTLANIAHNLGIGESTLYKWKNDFKPLEEALLRGKEVTDIIIENQLYKRAMGYTYNEDILRREFNEETGQYEMMLVERKVKHERPDVTAQIFWLKNRDTDKWNDRRVLNMEGGLNITNNNPLEELSADELRKLIAMDEPEDKEDVIEAVYEEVEEEDNNK